MEDCPRNSALFYLYEYRRTFGDVLQHQLTRIRSWTPFRFTELDKWLRPKGRACLYSYFHTTNRPGSLSWRAWNITTMGKMRCMVAQPSIEGIEWGSQKNFVFWTLGIGLSFLPACPRWASNIPLANCRLFSSVVAIMQVRAFNGIHLLYINWTRSRIYVVCYLENPIFL